MAEDVAVGASAPPAAERPAAGRAEKARASAYYLRFSFAYALLVMLAIGGVAGLVVVLLRPGHPPAPAWSAFVPSGSPDAVERQIATQVSSEYKASTAHRLVTVFPGPLQVTRFLQTGSGGTTSIEVPISSVAVAPDVSTGQHEASDYTFYSPGSTVAYEMCAFGSSQQNCGVVSGSGASAEKLLGREALELALYTLKYVSGTNAVIAFLPPPANSQAAGKAVLVSRKDVRKNLHDPLTRTLTPQKVFLGSGVPDAKQVEDVLRSHVFNSDYQTLPGDGTEILLLTPTTTG